MIESFHFLRPFWLLCILPLGGFAWYLLQRRTVVNAWSAVCDPHLLPWILQHHGRKKSTHALIQLLSCILFIIFSLSGPTWSRLPVPTYQPIQPHIVVLDMSSSMLERDLSPNRLTRAKFKLHDLLQYKDVGQFGLVVYTGEAFVVSPLTEDGQTIDALLSSLSPSIMPIEGNLLEKALEQAETLIKQAGYQTGNILVLTPTSPSPIAITTAKNLAQHGVDTSVIPLLKKDISVAFKHLAQAGQGELIAFTDTNADLKQWLAISKKNSKYSENLQNDIPVWKDQGRWFLIPALLLLLPVFRRGGLQRLNT